MDRLSKLGVAAVGILLGSAFPVSGVFAQTANVVGTWTLVSAIGEQGGKTTDTFGPGAKGRLSLDAEGHYMISIIGADLPKFASNNRANGTPEENKAVIQKSISHFGTYSVDAVQKTITFKIEMATFPNWNATEQIRPLTLSGDELTYAVKAASAGGSATVTWRRAK